MLLITAGSITLLIGAGLAFALQGNRARGAAALATQAIASCLVVAQCAPLLARGGELRMQVAWSFPIEVVSIHLDPLGAFFLAWSLPFTLLGTVYAYGYLRPYFETRNAGVQFALLNVISLSFIMIYTLESAFAFLLGWEVAAVAAWLLVVWDYTSQKIRFAGFNYLVSTHLGLFLLLAAFMVMHSQTGSMEFGSFAIFLRAPGRMRDLTFVLLVTSFGLKSAFFPFHTWLPRAHAAAPAHVSALMSGVIHKAGLFGLLRFTLLLGAPEPWMGWFLLVFSALSAAAGVLYTATQRDLKRLLGYSSTENVGIAGMSFGVGYLGLSWQQPALVALGFTGGVLHLLNHAVFKCLLFYAAGAVYKATHTVDLERLGGLSRRMPWTAGLFLIGGLGMSGVPPFNGFASEFLVYAGLLDPSVAPGLQRSLLVALAALLAFVGGVSALSTARAYGLVFLGTPRDAQVRCHGEVSGWLRAPMLLLAAAVIALGLSPALGLAFVEQPVRLLRELLPGEAALLPGPALLLAPVARMGAVLVGLFGALVLLRRLIAPDGPAPRHVTWGCGYTAGTSRVQYTGASFSAPLAALFPALLPMQRTEKLPEGPFPAENGRIGTHSVDAVERRMFQVIDEGDDLVTHVAARVPGAVRLSLGSGLLVLGLLVWLLVSHEGGGFLR